MTERIERIGAGGRRTASALAQDLVMRIADRVRRPPAQLRPTIYLALRRGEDPSFKDVVARSV